MNERTAYALKVTWIGAWINLVLSAVKIFFGWLGHSPALIADGIHSLSDLATDVIVVWGSKVGDKSADLDHPYGHARIETLATVIMGLVLFLLAAGIFWDAASRLLQPERLTQPTAMAFLIALLSIVVKEALYRYTMVAAKKIDSQLLRANAWHHRSDAFSSVVVGIGIFGNFLGMPWWDPLAAIGVALMIAHLSHELIWQGLKELIDTGANPDELAEIEQLLQSTSGVKDVHLLRTRKMGNKVLVDVHLIVDDKISVSEGHQISDAVRFKLIESIDNISDVMVHIDPENDEHLDGQTCINRRLPLRGLLMQQLQQYWQTVTWREQSLFAQIQRIHLHYLRGHLSVDIYFPLEILSHPRQTPSEQAQQLSDRLNQALPDKIHHPQGDYTLQLMIYYS
jgi:cation diffusion facilitator family transporter